MTEGTRGKREGQGVGDSHEQGSGDRRTSEAPQEETFASFFRRAFGPEADPELAPYPYQQALADDGLPELLACPTGTGKTEAAVLPHLYRRLIHPDDAVRATTPRWLAIVLPQRSLVEQTVKRIEDWLKNLGLAHLGPHILMGGASTSDRRWKLEPAQEAVFVGTQDMVLSRLLMRGYGESRASWPISFGLLHADTQFVYDELQLMGPALPTSLQLDAFRSRLGAAGRSRSMWMSATVDTARMATVDRPETPKPTALTNADISGRLQQRLDATRTIREMAVDSSDDREAAIARAVVAAHQPGTRTIVVANTVDRARRVYEAVTTLGPTAETVLLHSRFRPNDREGHTKRAIAAPGPEGTIVVATQVLEAGVDITSRLLVTDAAPWSSIVQRAGRCNRGGEHPPGEAELWWVDLPDKRGAAAPYEEDDVAATVTALRARESVAVTSRDLQQAEVAEVEPLHPVLRRSDLVDLFDTTTDLAGNDVDVSRWIRDAEERTVSVAWRPVARSATGPVPVPDDKQPGRAELCPAPLADMKKFVTTRTVAVFDQQAGTWRVARAEDVRPSATLVVEAKEGGYDPDVGWSPKVKNPVEPVPSDGPEATGYADDPGVRLANCWVTLTDHLADTAKEAQEIFETYGDLPGIDADLTRSAIDAAAWHDLGKAHPIFVARMKEGPAGAPPDDEIYAKSPEQARHTGPVFRHELASALMLLEEGSLLARSPHPFLPVYLVAAHHGKVRLSIRSTISDRAEGTVLGVKEGSATLATSAPPDDHLLPPVTMHLDRIGLGRHDGQASWQGAATALRDELGPFRLAFLEAVVRMADWRSSSGYGLTEEDLGEVEP